MTKTSLWLSLGLGIGLGISGCGQQPYRVFAVQVAAAPAAAPAAANTTRPQASSVSGLRAKHPQWDLNRAPVATLAQLPGISAATATAIVAGRPYKSKRELLKRKIVTAAEYARWKDYLVVHRASGTTP